MRKYKFGLLLIVNVSLILWVLGFMISLSSCSNDLVSSDETGTNFLPYNEILNVSYGNDVNQVYDIYLPEGRDTNTKVMVLIHGGGWTAGDKNDMNLLKDLYRLNIPNLAIVNINYRLADMNNSAYPMQVNDITAVMNHLSSNKEQYVISSNYGLLGTSAGGHLALLWSYALNSENNVKMVGSIVGPTNFTDPAFLNSNEPLLQLVLDTYNINTNTEYLEEISPLHRVTSNAPPTILFYGGQDPLIPSTQGTNMRDQLDLLGVTNEFTLYLNAGHGWDGAELLDTWNKLEAFTKQYL